MRLKRVWNRGAVLIAALVLCGGTALAAEQVGNPRLAVLVDAYDIVSSIAASGATIVALPVRASVRCADWLSLELLARRAAGSLGRSSAAGAGLAFYPIRTSPLGLGAGVAAGISWGEILGEPFVFLPLNAWVSYSLFWPSRLAVRVGIGASCSVPLTAGYAVSWDVTPSVSFGVWE